MGSLSTGLGLMVVAALKLRGLPSKSGAGSVEVSSVAHLGKKLDDKHRLMKVRFSSMQQKHRVLPNAKKLRSLSSTL